MKELRLNYPVPLISRVLNVSVSGYYAWVDRGIQYACDEYRRLLESHHIVSSMSRSGNCLDNAVAERFFCTLKMECLLNWRDMTAEEVKNDIIDYIEMFYNSEKLHSFNGYLSPNDYEKNNGGPCLSVRFYLTTTN